MDVIKKTITILIAEDDEDDYFLTKKAFKMSRVKNQLRWVKDGEELLEYLLRTGPYEAPETSPRPGLILLDLNMPKKDGREALKEIKENPKICDIPIIVLTTSNAEEEIVRAYQLGVNSYVRKPVKIEKFIETIVALNQYWFEIVELPPTHEED